MTLIYEALFIVIRIMGPMRSSKLLIIVPQGAAIQANNFFMFLVLLPTSLFLMILFARESKFNSQISVHLGVHMQLILGLTTWEIKNL